jgi:CelD/BcsL family acetyltransferase involved in cellulose biosynthesis
MSPTPSISAVRLPTSAFTPVRWALLPVARLADVEPAWRALHASGWATPVLAYEFVSALVKAFARGDERVALAHRDGRAVAAGILQRDARLAWSTFQPAQAPLGAWVQDAAEPDALALAHGLLRALPQPALVLGLTQQDPLRIPRPADAGYAATLDYIRTGAVRVDRTFEAYWAERDKKVRYEMKRRLARLAEQGLQPRLEKETRAAAAAAQVDAFGELESAGWKAAGGTAVHAGNVQGAFYRDVMTRFCALGRGRIYRYAAGDRVLAMQLAVEHAGTLAFLKTTYDERLRAASPGVLMKAEIFRDLFAAGGIARVEFYGSVKEWQLKWIDELRTQYHLNVYRWPLLRRARETLARVRGGHAPLPRDGE